MSLDAERSLTLSLNMYGSNADLKQLRTSNRWVKWWMRSETPRGAHMAPTWQLVETYADPTTREYRYYGQELLSTFESSIGELALIPTTGGIFTVHLEYNPDSADSRVSEGLKETLIWDRKVRNLQAENPLGV